MIRCPSCGTLNQDSRQTCRNCGIVLPQTRLRCPKCGTLNPVGNLFCDNCNTRLVHPEDALPPEHPSTPEDDRGGAAVKGISLPTRSSPSEGNEASPIGLPDWLSGLIDEDTEFGEANAQAESDADLPLDPNVLPDWLKSGESEESGIVEEAEPAAQPLPDWLAPMAGETVTADEPEEDEGELPDWFSQMAGAVSSEEPAPPASPDLGETEPDAETELDAQEPGSDLPDWMLDLSDEDAGPTELPQWLTDLAEESSPEPAVEPEQVSELAADENEHVEKPPESAQPEPESVPDWLAGLDLTLPSEPQAGIFSDEPVDTEEAPSEAVEPLPTEGPSWLRGLRADKRTIEGDRGTPAFLEQDIATEPGEEASELSLEGPEEIPEWLQGLDFTAPTTTHLEPPSSLMGELAPAEVPSWLQELAPPEAAEMGRGAESVAPFSELTPADIPDWVKALRPAPQENQELPAQRAVFPTPAEPEGPLKGIPGVLPSLIAVDVPSDARLSVATSIPDSVIAQAQLWQQLLEQPRSAERPVPQERLQTAGNTRLTRWLVAAILVLATFAAFWLLPEGLSLSHIPGSEIAPGVVPFVDSLNQLQAGDRVILAIEYTPGYAEEMAQIAAPIIDQLNTLDAEVLVVSTLPQGIGLSYALSPQPRNRVELTGSGYVAGNVTGIAEFLTRPEAQAARHLVVLTSDPQRLRWWIEQNILISGQAGASLLPLSVGVSAATGALVAPYLHTENVTGWVAGFPQALSYREVTGIGSNQAYARILDVLTLAQWIVVGLLLMALVYRLVERKGAS